MKNLKLLLSIIVLCVSCNVNKDGGGNGSIINLDRNGVKQVHLTDPDEIVFDDLLNPAAFYVMYDTLVVVQNQPNCDYLIEMYSFNSQTPVGQFAQKGGGPDDFLSCSCFVPSGRDSVICALDRNSGTYSVINIPLTLAQKRLHISRRFRYDPEIHPYSDIIRSDDEHYIGYNMWYMDSRQYTNDVPALKRYSARKKDDYSAEGNDMSKYAYFVASVNDARLAFNPQTKAIWLFDGHQDKITVFDDSLQVIKTVRGPDSLQPSYTDIKSNASIPFVTFSEGKEYRTYTNYTVTDKYIYVIYEGANGGRFNPEDLQPVEVFQFDMEGHLRCIYKLDRFIYTVSVDSKGKYMYCSARTSVMDEAHFVRYKID